MASLILVIYNGKPLAQDNKDNGESNFTFEQQIKIFGEKQTNKVPKDYTPEEATENGDITPTNITSKQREKINQFKENVKNGNPDFIQFSQSGDQIITKFQFNGEFIYCRWDSTRVESRKYVAENMDTGEQFSE